MASSRRVDRLAMWKHTCEVLAEKQYIVSMNDCIYGTRTHTKLPISIDTSSPQFDTKYECLENTTTIAACLASDLPTLCALNFASARHPGGGVVKGASAQEESLCRVSGLYQCLSAEQNDVMYRLNNDNARNGLYQHCGLYSPAVPIIKDDDGTLLPVPRYVSFITIPAVNRKAAKAEGLTESIIDSEMRRRIDGVLSIAVFYKQYNLVLGAFGCGVFGNVVDSVAWHFHKLLTTKYEGRFENVIFATIDERESRAFAHYFE